MLLRLPCAKYSPAKLLDPRAEPGRSTKDGGVHSPTIVIAVVCANYGLGGTKATERDARARVFRDQNANESAVEAPGAFQRCSSLKQNGLGLKALG